MLILSISIRIPTENEETAKVLNNRIVNTVKEIPGVSVSCVLINTLTRPEDLRKQ